MSRVFLWGLWGEEEGKGFGWEDVWKDDIQIL